MLALSQGIAKPGINGRVFPRAASDHHRDAAVDVAADARHVDARARAACLGLDGRRAPRRPVVRDFYEEGPCRAAPKSHRLRLCARAARRRRGGAVDVSATDPGGLAALRRWAAHECPSRCLKRAVSCPPLPAISRRPVASRGLAGTETECARVDAAAGCSRRRSTTPRRYANECLLSTCIRMRPPAH